MEEWHVMLAGGEYAFSNLSDAMAWLGGQTAQAATLHRVSRTVYTAYGVPGGSAWPTPPTNPPKWVEEATTHQRVTRG